MIQILLQVKKFLDHIFLLIRKRNKNNFFSIDYKVFKKKGAKKRIVKMVQYKNISKQALVSKLIES